MDFLANAGHSNLCRFRYPKVRKKYREKVFNSLLYRGARWLQVLPACLLESPNASVSRSRLRKINLLSTLRFDDISCRYICNIAFLYRQCDVVAFFSIAAELDFCSLSV